MTCSGGCALLKVPTKATLRKYGLSYVAWARIAMQQGSVCAICGNLPKSGRLQIDHFHAKGWRKMIPMQRASYVRGLCCFRCNSQFLRRGLTWQLAKKVVDYLQAFDRVMS